MGTMMDFLHEFNCITIAIRLLLAVLAGGIVGNERGRHGSAAGLRTHILVCVGAAMTALIGCFAYEHLAQDDVLRIAAQVVSGIGFLGAGMIIIKNNNVITGLTTAAGMWATATIGIALGYGFYSGALIATVFCVITATLLPKFERRRKRTSGFYVEIEANKNVGIIAERIRSELDADAVIKFDAPKSNVPNSISMYVVLHDVPADAARQTLDRIDGVRFSVEE